MLELINFKELAEAEIMESLFAGFNRFQDVKKCWRKENLLPLKMSFSVHKKNTWNFHAFIHLMNIVAWE